MSRSKPKFPYLSTPATVPVMVGWARAVLASAKNISIQAKRLQRLFMLTTYLSSKAFA